MQFEEIPPGLVPLALLLEADPSEGQIQRYLTKCRCYAAKQQGKVVGACLFLPIEHGVFELMNIAVDPKLQAQGIGSRLLGYGISAMEQLGAKKLQLGTGTFGHQLAFYQRAGFRVTAVVRDHFVDNYDEPIFESGIQHKDMLRLELALGPQGADAN